jgi:hypothetical protein
MPVLQKQNAPHYDGHTEATIIRETLRLVFQVSELEYEFIGIFREQGSW